MLASVTLACGFLKPEVVQVPGAGSQPKGVLYSDLEREQGSVLQFFLFFLQHRTLKLHRTGVLAERVLLPSCSACPELAIVEVGDKLPLLQAVGL